MHRSEEQEHLKAALEQKPWRIPAEVLEKRRTRTFNIGLQELFKRLADPNTSEHEARGLIQSIMFAEHEEVTKGTEEGKSIRRTIIAMLTDIGRTPTPEEHGMLADLDGVCRTARVTLAKHVAPHICARNVYNDGVEHLATLTDLVRFYGTLAKHDPHVYFDSEVSNRDCTNIRDMLERVYLALRSGLGVAAGRDPSSVIPEVVGTVQAALRDLTALFVRLQWWEVLVRVRAVAAVPLLYEYEEVADRTSPNFIPLWYDWQDIETLRVSGALSDRSYAEGVRDTILHDVAAILAASGGRFDPSEHAGRMRFSGIESLRGLFPLLHDLVATFVREVELACPGVLTDDIPLPEKQTCLQHDECFNEAVRTGRAERAMQAGTERTVYMMRFGDAFIHWTTSATKNRNFCESRIALLKNDADSFTLVDTPERQKEHLRELLAVLAARESKAQPTDWVQVSHTHPEQQANTQRLATVYGREDGSFPHWTTICFSPDISIAHYRAAATATLDALNTLK